MINVKEINDRTFEISWDENDPAESVLNTWTEQDFIEVILDYVKKNINNHEKNNIIIDQTSEEVQQDITTIEKFINENPEEERFSRVFF